MKLTVIGHGYVGLVTAAVFADLGNNVWVIGRTKRKINRLKKGEVSFYEPGLEEVVKRNLQAGRLHFTLDYKKAIPSSKVVFICVGTPSKDNGVADLSSVFEVAERTGKHIRNYTVIACKSTVPAGTNRKIKKLLTSELRLPCLAGRQATSKFDVASCPEFLREGTALADTFHPDRIVIGTESKKAKEILLELHKPINGVRLLTNLQTAEMIKYASNALLATKVSFANMLAFLCEKVGADVEKVLDGVGMDKRLGRNFLYPGVGYGGSCLPKDVKALIKTGEAYREDMTLLKEADKINKQAVERFTEKVSQALKGRVEGKTIGILGLSFKPNTDDLREAPSLKIITTLKSMGNNLKIKVYDPKAMLGAKKILKNVIYCENPYQVAKDADILLIVTEWNEFRQLDLGKIKLLMKKPIIVDGRNIYDPGKMRVLGFKYIGVGRV